MDRRNATINKDEMAENEGWIVMEKYSKKIVQQYGHKYK